MNVNTGSDCVKVDMYRRWSMVPLKASENKGRGGQKEVKDWGSDTQETALKGEAEIEKVDLKGS